MSSYHLSQLVSWVGKLCFDFPPSLIKWFTSKSAGKLIFKGQRLGVLICLDCRLIAFKLIEQFAIIKSVWNVSPGHI